MSGYKSTCWHLVAWKHQSKSSWDFLGSSVVKTLPSNAGDIGSIPGRGITIPHAMRQLSPRAATTEPTCSRAHMPQPERRPCAAANIQHSQINRFFKNKAVSNKSSKKRRPMRTVNIYWWLQFSSAQFSHSVVSDSLQPHELQHARPPCPSQLPEFTQTHVHQVSDAIQPSHPRLSPSPPAPNPSQHQSLFQWVNPSHEVAIALEFQLQHHSFQRNPRVDLLQNGLVGSPCSPRDSQESSPTPQFKSINSLALSLLHWWMSNSHTHTWPQEKP